MTRVVVASGRRICQVDPSDAGGTVPGDAVPFAPSGLAADPRRPGRVWCATDGDGVMRSDDGGGSWTPVGLPSGLEGEKLMTVAVGPGGEGAAGAADAGSTDARSTVWAGAEPSAVWRSDDHGATWRPTSDLTDLPSSPDWAFPPRPETHHVRWIACHPADAGRLWVAVEAGALIRTTDGGRTWLDRVPGGPYDTHELAVHAERPELLRVAAGDGYYESVDGGDSWSSPMEGLGVGYLRSVAVDPGDRDVVVVSASSGPRSAYVAGRGDGRVYRREGSSPWERVTAGWPDEPSTIAPLLVAGRSPGELFAADERGVHRSGDGGSSWERVAAFDPVPEWLRGIAVAAALELPR